MTRVAVGTTPWGDALNADLNAIEAKADLANLSGSGMPEGAVTANVGTLYRDTTKTNGASLWLKSSGTGNTGWIVISGDTGWRACPGENGWTGTVYLRRVNGMVEARITALDSTAATAVRMLTIPSGFSYPFVTGLGAVRAFATIGGTSDPEPVALINVVSGGIDFAPAVPASGTLYASATWTAAPAWPTTLPGVAA